MEFAEAWDALQMGDQVTVSNGTPRPEGTGMLFKVWRSHNFTGHAVEWIDGPPRAIRVEEDEADGIQVSFTITETSGDTFSL